jgi:hypothetical protein
VTDPAIDIPPDPTAVAGMLRDLRAGVDQLRKQLRGLEDAYRDAGGDLKNRAAADTEYIHQLKDEAERLITLLRGGSLFGRYEKDAERHRRVADRWRFFAVSILLASAALAVGLASFVPSLGWVQIAAPITPLLLLFTYASMESSNHRWREFDRRRIYLRMAAIESYIRPGRDGEENQRSEKLLDDFIRRHFLAPDLDPNDTNYVLARGMGPFRARIGRRGQDSPSKEE